MIIGSTGQLGTELLRQAWPPQVELVAPSREELDLASADSIRAAISRQPVDCVINAAAYTAVDAAEDDKEAAFLLNCHGPGWLAEAASKAGIPLVHISTDYVFRGDAVEPYEEGDEAHPINVYGASKAAGEKAVIEKCEQSVIVRTSWMISAHRSNFLKTILRLAAGQTSVRIVSDQQACPTSAADLAAALALIAFRLIGDSNAPVGIYHFVNSGNASWHELAVEILLQSRARGGPCSEVLPISAEEYGAKARRPANSRLATGKISRDYGIEPRDWQTAVADILDELSHAGQLKELTR
jgi:dTDP-4-dehydrorhamnose reductase